MPLASPDSAFPLTGKTIFLSRPEDERNDNVIAQLTQAGAKVIHIPLIEIQTAPFAWIPAQAVDCLWLTSTNALQGWTQHAEFKPEAWQSHLIAVVGPGTEVGLRQHQLIARFVSPVSNAKDAVRLFQEQVDCKRLRILWPHGNRAASDLKALLEEAGAQVQEQIVYRTQTRSALSETEHQRLQANPIDIVLFTSPSTVDAYADLWQNAHLKLLPDSPLIACFGPSTANQALKRLGKVDIQANAKHFQDFIQHLQDYFIQRECN